MTFSMCYSFVVKASSHSSVFSSWQPFVITSASSLLEYCSRKRYTMCESKRLPEYLTHKLAFLLVALLLAACGGSNAGSNNGSHPIVLQVVDAGGYSSQVQPMLQAYQKAHPDKISKIVYPPRIPYLITRGVRIVALV